MYIVRYKKSKKIVHTNFAPLEPELKGKEVYEKFNSTTMELLKCKEPALPPHYTVDKKGFIQPMSLKEQVKEGVIELEPEQKVENGQIVPKSLGELVKDGLVEVGEPFTYYSPEENALLQRSIKELVEGNLLENPEQCEKVNEMIREEVKEKVEEMTDVSYELKLLKDFVEWMDEGKPEGDEREKQYRSLQNRIRNVKKAYADYKEKVLAKLETFK